MITAVQSTTAWTTQNLVSATQRRKEMFEQLDADGDGKITQSELEAARPSNGRGPDAASLIKQIDTDGDGAINESENDAFLSKMENGRPPAGPPPGGGPRGSSKEQQTRIFDPLDTNKDGKVSAEELLAAKMSEGKGLNISEILGLADSGEDRSISEDEIDTFREKLEEFTKSMMRGVSTYDGKGNQNAGTTGGVVDATM
jgi:Ca2+-binding EF-hand superfamily protein